MAGRLTQVFRAVDQSLKHQAAHVQKRYVGNLPVKPNPYVEDWATKRENVELTFKFDGKTLATLGVAAVTVPYMIYHMCISEFVSIRNAHFARLRKTQFTFRRNTFIRWLTSSLSFSF